jgi:hypothetical protein
MNIINKVKAIYDHGEMSHLLFKYVDRNFWSIKIKKEFSDKYIDNLTDFNYNKCFSLYISLSDNNSPIGSKEFDEYIIKNKNLYIAAVEISVLAPYCILKYLRYYMEEEIKCDCIDTTYCKEYIKFDEEIKEFFLKSNLILLDDEILMTEIPDKSLELKEAPVSAYNCLFQDNYDYYPYIKSNESKT